MTMHLLQSGRRSQRSLAQRVPPDHVRTTIVRSDHHDHHATKCSSAWLPWPLPGESSRGQHSWAHEYTGRGRCTVAIQRVEEDASATLMMRTLPSPQCLRHTNTNGCRIHHSLSCFTTSRWPTFSLTTQQLLGGRIRSMIRSLNTRPTVLLHRPIPSAI